MGTVGIQLDGRDYRIACDDGQEERLSKLGGYLEERSQELKTALGSHVSHDLLLVMTSLLIADEMTDMAAELEDSRLLSEQSGSADSEERRQQAEIQVAKAIESIAHRMERIAQSLEES